MDLFMMCTTVFQITLVSDNQHNWNININKYIYEGKIVPLHTTVVQVEEVYLLLFHDLGTRWVEWSASRPGERTTGTHCTGGCVGPRAGQDTEGTGKI
jgi:hypothetical protein